MAGGVKKVMQEKKLSDKQLFIILRFLERAERTS